MAGSGVKRMFGYGIGNIEKIFRGKRIGRAAIAVWISLCCMGAAAVPAAGADESAGAGASNGSDVPSSVVTIRSSATVAGNHIHLSDLVAPESIPYFGANAKDGVLMDAPNPGNDRLLPGSWVVSVIRSKGRLPDSAAVAAPEQVHVRRSHQSISSTRLADFFTDYVARRTGDSEFTITRMKVRGTEKFPVGPLALQVLTPEPRSVVGRVNLRLTVKVGGEKFGWLTLSGWVDRYETVVCGSRYLTRGTVLEPSDLRYERMNTSRMPAGVIRDLDEAVGKRLKCHVKDGHYLRQNMLTVPPLIEEGDKVKLVAGSGNLTIVTFGIAKSDGRAGEQIRIENMTSKKTLVGRVADDATVEVVF